MRKFSAYTLLTLLFGSVLVMWSTYRWATAGLQIGAFCLAAIWAVSLARSQSNARFNIVLIPLCATVLWPLVQLALNHTVYRWQTWNFALYWGTNLAVFFAGLQTFDDEPLRKRFLDALLIFGTILSVISPLQLFTSNGKVFWLFPTEYVSDLLGPFVYRNQYAAFIEILLPVALWNGFAGGKNRVYYLLAAAVMYSSVIASASRMGFALSTLELFLVPVLLAVRGKVPARSFAMAGGVFAAIVLISVAAAGPETVWDRFHSKDIYAVRREFTESSLAMIRTRPLTGFGLGTWSTAYPGYALFDDGNFANQAHNDWAQWTVEGGLPFTAVMLWIALWSARRGFRTIWGLGPAVVFVHCFVDYPIQRIASAGILFALLSATSDDSDKQVTRKRVKSNSDRSFPSPLSRENIQSRA